MLKATERLIISSKLIISMEIFISFLLSMFSMRSYVKLFLHISFSFSGSEFRSRIRQILKKADPMDPDRYYCIKPWAHQWWVGRKLRQCPGRVGADRRRWWVCPVQAGPPAPRWSAPRRRRSSPRISRSTQPKKRGRSVTCGNSAVWRGRIYADLVTLNIA